MGDSTSPFGTLTARLDERLLAPLRAGTFARRTWFSVTLVAILALHGALLGWMLWRDAANPVRMAKVEETPVEIVQDAPPPPSPQSPAAKPEIEKPATSAPRAPNETTAETDRQDKDTHAPKSASPPNEGDPKPAETDAAASEAPPTPEKADEAQAPKPPDVLQKDAEALDKAAPEPPKKPKALAKAQPAKPKTLKSAAQQLAGASALPDYTFAKPMKKRAKVFGGSEDDRYLAVVYGMIVQNRRAIDVPYGDWSVSVSFVVDGAGNLLGVQVSHSSGYPEVDEQAVESVESAAPFPPPPSGGNTGLVARLRATGTNGALVGER